ncbi:MAG: hypothetical protein ABMA25_05650 [Ilumatobacteraceae bacterium]
MSRRQTLVWLARVVVAGALLGGAWWWSGHRAAFGGLSYCEQHHIVECADAGFGFEGLFPYALWPITAFATCMIVVGAALVAPATLRSRALWAAMIGCSVFVAHRNNILWAIVVTGAAIWGVMKITDDLPDPPRRRLSIRSSRQVTSILDNREHRTS